MRFHLALVGALVAVVGCTSVRTYEMPKVQNDLSVTMASTDALISKSQTDFREKSSLVENLKRADAPEFAAAEPTLRKYLAAMEASLATMTSERQQMVDANGAVAALGYAHSSVGRDAPEYAKVEAAVADFEESARAVKAAVLDYSSESSSLADEVSSRRLFYTFDVAEFQKKLQSDVKSAQENMEAMKKELQRAGAARDKSPEQEKILSEMTTSAQEYNAKAQGFLDIAKNVTEAAQGNAKVSTLDNSWPGLQKLVGQYDGLMKELSHLHEKFQSDLERYRTPFKRVG